MSADLQKDFKSSWVGHGFFKRCFSPDQSSWTQMLTWLKTSQQWANKVNLLAFPVTNMTPLHEHWRCLDEATNCACTLSTCVTWYWGTIIVHHIKAWNISILSRCISMQPFLSRLNLTHLRKLLHMHLLPGQSSQFAYSAPEVLRTPKCYVRDVEQGPQHIEPAGC